MPNNLDLDAIKRDLEDLSDETYLTVKGARQSLIEAVPDLIAEVERLRSDNEATDGTDYAHPSYWRGSDAAFAAMSEQLRKILDGEDDCKGVCREPWDTLRRRVLALRQELATAKKIAAAEWHEAEAKKYSSPMGMCERAEHLRIAAELRAEVK